MKTLIDEMNPILNTDSYKYSHFEQYPSFAKQVSAYVEPRWNNEAAHDVMFFGLQMFLQKYMTTPIVPSDIDEAEALITAHGLPFNREGFERIFKEWNGYWPVTIQALPEGTVHGSRITQVQIKNNDVELPWVTTFIETALMRAIWYPVNVATRSFHVKQIVKKWLEKTADTTDSLIFKLHDFGARGVSSLESAGIGGCAHLVNFRGTDTVMALVYANNFYNEKVAGYSIPAAEHSTITAWEKSREVDAYKNMIMKFGGPGKMFAMVLDSYDVHNCLENIIGGELVNALKSNGAVCALRLDSGDPEREPVKAMHTVGERFGFTINSKGYKMLPPYLRIVQGDGVNVEMIDKCCSNIERGGWSIDNIGTFGMGGELLQKHDRDTHGYAMKCNAINKLDEHGWYDISKNPVGDPTKASKPGRRGVLKRESKSYIWFEDVPEKDLTDEEIALKNELRVVHQNGENMNEETFAQIRERADSFLR